MKKIVLAVAITAIAATATYAGGMAEPVMEAPVIMEEAASSSAGGLLVPLLLLVLVAAAVAAS